MSNQDFHSEWMRKVKTMAIDSLRYVIKDCQEAIAANPENPKCGQYMDICLYCSQEIKRRGE